MDRSLHETDYIEFENLVGQIFVRNGFEVIKKEGRRGYDFRISKGESRAIVEVKLYRTKLPKIELLRQACLNFPIRPGNEARILIVSSYVTPSIEKELEREYGVQIWDVATLLALSFEYDELYLDFEIFLGKIFRESLDMSFSTQFLNKGFVWRKIGEPRVPPGGSIGKPRSTRESDLCKELRNIQKGRLGAADFEDKCTEILKHLFDNKMDLELWYEQSPTDDGLSKFDLVCRIISGQKNTFWTELAHDFHCRYIVFEFKNYTDPIKQTQIYTTEKYLYTTALRSVCFMITKNGADENAKKAAKGALKEAGKLIIILTVEDLCEMLDEMAKGNEPSSKLKDKLDKMLVELTR